MDSTDLNDNTHNSHSLDLDADIIPRKKRKLTDETSPVSVFSNETQEYTLASGDDEKLHLGNNSILDGNKQSLSDNLDDGLKKRATSVSDDIFEDITPEDTEVLNLTKANSEISPVEKSKLVLNVENGCQDQKNNISKGSNNEMISCTKNCNSQIFKRSGNTTNDSVTLHGNENEEQSCDDLKKDDLCSVHKLTYTSNTQEYTLLNDSQDLEAESTNSPDHEESTLKHLDGTASAKSKNVENIIMLDDSLETEGVQKSVPDNSKEKNNNACLPCVKKTPSIARDAKIISSIIPCVNFNTIYNKLLENRDNVNRLDIVTTNLLEATATGKDDLQMPTKNITEDVELIVKQFPTADADLVYAFLESIENVGDRVERTIKEMGLRRVGRAENEEKERPVMLKKKSTLADDPVLASDPLFSDMRKVAKVFPDRDRNEIYALLEAHVDKSDRIQIVINELLQGMQRNDADIKTKPDTPVLQNNITSMDTPAVIDLTDFCKMDSTDLNDNTHNSHSLDLDDGIIPCKKRKLTDETSPASLFSNETQEYTLASGDDEKLYLGDNFILDGNKQSLSDNLDDGLKKRATSVSDDIFEDITPEDTEVLNLTKANSEISPVEKSKSVLNVENGCQDQKNNISKGSNNEMISCTKNCNSQIFKRSGNTTNDSVTLHGNENEEQSCDDLKKDDLCSVHKLTYTSNTQEYTLLNDSQDLEAESTNSPDHEESTLKHLDGTASAKSKNVENIIMLDDSLETEGVQKSVPDNSKEKNNNACLPCVKKTPSIARDAKIISSIIPYVNFNTIYNKLLENRDNVNRLDIVTTNLLEATATGKDDLQMPTKNITEDVELIVKQFPTADADLVYAFLESIENVGDRVERTIKEMGLRRVGRAENEEKERPVMLKKKSTLADDPVLASDPLFSDMRKVAKVFPDRDRNEIYALLEAHVDKSDRIQIVINELLQGMQRNNADIKAKPDTPLESLPNNITSMDTPAMIDLTDIPGNLPEQEDVDHLILLFPDCDPNYLFEKIEAMKDVPDRRMVLAAELTEKKNYPKLQDRLEKEKLEEEKKKQIKRNFTVEEFLNKFPDPQTTFGNPTKPLSDTYKAHARASILNDFLVFKTQYLIKTLEEYNFHYYLASQKVNNVLVQTPLADRRLHSRFMKTKRKKLVPLPTENDEYFFHEYWFTHNELNIEDYKKQKMLERQTKVEEAREKGELYECCCCYEDECLFEDLANCPEGHLFCKVCVVRSTEAAFGEMKNRFPCLTGECDESIPLSTLQGIIPPNLFSKIVSRLQEEEVLQAQIPDLVTCPFCPFATIMPDPDDKILKCLNPECLKESCRLCREESHIPLKCNEVESRAGTKMRTYIENKVAEAVMRKCHKCGKRFLKDTGCNKMTCVCGGTSCYFCKEPNIDYGHFDRNKMCAQTDPNKIHERDMKEAAKKAMEEYILEHPEAADLDLQSDLKDVIQNCDTNITDNMDYLEPYQDDRNSDSETDEEDYY